MPSLPVPLLELASICDNPRVSHRRNSLSLSALALASSAFVINCVPKGGDPHFSDLDKDGVVDAFDRCMADPEDIDGFEDEDGCPEEGSAAAGTVRPAISVVSDGQAGAKGSERQPNLSQTKVRLLKLKTKTSPAKVRLLKKSAWGAKLSGDARYTAIFGFGKTWLGKTPSSEKEAGKLKKIPVDGYEAIFSPDSSIVAIFTEKGLWLTESASAKVIKKIPYSKNNEGGVESKALVFQDNSHFLFFDGCTLRRYQVGNAKALKTLAQKSCGKPLVSSDASSWILWADEEEQVHVQTLPLDGTKAITLLSGVANGPGLVQALLSPDGKQLCYSATANGSQFSCVDLATKKEYLISSDIYDKRAAFAPGGELVWGQGALGNKRPIMGLDWGSKRILKLGKKALKYKWIKNWGKGIALTGGPNIHLLDLATQGHTEVKLPKGQWEGFAQWPGLPSQFILGKERKATRDLYIVEVP